MRIGIDAMGGDFAPEAVVLGTLEASKAIGSDSKIVLFGNQSEIDDLFAKNGGCPANVEIVPTTEVIGMGESPAQAFTGKPNSSIVVGFTHLKMGKIDGFASAGSTGAMMAGCIFVSKPVEGVMRPAIGTKLVASNGEPFFILDIGLNVDCKPEVLAQYGVIGSVYCKDVLGIENPRVALLNIGEEEEKGNAQTKATYQVMKQNSDKYNFVGNIEAKYMFKGGVADVIVCDGFVGNTILKLCEGIFVNTDQNCQSNRVISAFNYEVAGGTPVLGVNNCVVIAHGCSSPLAIKNMILQVEESVKSSFVENVKKAFKAE